MVNKYYAIELAFISGRFFILVNNLHVHRKTLRCTPFTWKIYSSFMKEYITWSKTRNSALEANNVSFWHSTSFALASPCILPEFNSPGPHLLIWGVRKLGDRPQVSDAILNDLKHFVHPQRSVVYHIMSNIPSRIPGM